LREISIGEWEGLSWEEIGDRWPEQFRYFGSDPAKWSVPGSENFIHLQERITGCIKDIAKVHDGETVAIVSHGTAIRTFLCEITGHQLQKIWEIPYINTAVAMMFFENEELKLEYYGDNSHLNNEHS